jgi:hypothetical protein
VITRRRPLGAVGCSAALAGSGTAFPHLLEAEGAVPNLPAGLPLGLRAEAVLDALPGKKPLIKLSYRPPNYETPISYFRTPLTPVNVRTQEATPEATAFGVTVPQLSLPKGGGAIRGIGEKFSVNTATSPRITPTLIPQLRTSAGEPTPIQPPTPSHSATSSQSSTATAHHAPLARTLQPAQTGSSKRCSTTASTTQPLRQQQS